MIGLIVSIHSGFRVGIVLIFLIVVEMVIWVLFNRRKRKTLLEAIKIAIFLAIIISVATIAILNYIKIVEWIGDVFEMDQYKLFRVTERMQGLLNFDSSMSQDTERIENMNVPIKEFFKCIFPTGLIAKTTGSVGRYIDVPVLWFYDSFGSLATIAVLIICCINGIRAFYMSFKANTSDCITVCGLMFPITVVFMVVNGNFLYYTYQCILTGMIAGIWFSNHKKIFRGMRSPIFISKKRGKDEISDI